MRKSFVDYRLCNNKLPSRCANIDRSLRKCNLCKSGTVGDEFHYVLEGCFFDFDRKIFYHIITGNMSTALPMPIYLMILTLGEPHEYPCATIIIFRGHVPNTSI